MTGATKHLRAKQIRQRDPQGAVQLASPYDDQVIWRPVHAKCPFESAGL